MESDGLGSQPGSAAFWLCDLGHIVNLSEPPKDNSIHHPSPPAGSISGSRDGKALCKLQRAE